MRHLLIPFFALMLCLQGCGGGSSEIMQLVAERDSLRAENQSQAEALERFNQTIDVINATFDSIASQDGLIFVSNGEQPLTRGMVLSNLERFENVLNRQQDKIKQLERALAQQADSTNAAMLLIKHLKEQVEIKNAQIRQLKAEVEDKNVNIANLQAQVESQQMRIQSQDVAINELTIRNKKQGEALSRQDALLNNGYVLIGTEDDLKRKGIIKRHKIVADAALDRSKFVKVDIRTWREISFTAKRPKILTNMPSTSYELVTNGRREYTLKVLNPSDFWRISNYLVIQTD